MGAGAPSGVRVERRRLEQARRLAPRDPATVSASLAAAERELILATLRRHPEKREAARVLGIGLRTLRNKLKAWREAGLPVPPADPAERPLPPGAFDPEGELPAGLAAACLSQGVLHGGRP